MTAVTPAPHHSLQALRDDWAEALPLELWAPSFGWDYEGEPPAVPKWRVRRWKLLAFVHGYSERFRAIRALTTDPSSSDSKTGTIWSRSKWNRLHVIPSLLVGPVTFTEPDYNANTDELAAYDGDGGSYSWSVTLLHATYGWAPLRRVYIYRESESTY
jgi:hypothetical protein